MSGKIRAVLIRCLRKLSPTAWKTAAVHVFFHTFLWVMKTFVMSCIDWFCVFSLTLAIDLKFSTWPWTGKCHVDFLFLSFAQKNNFFFLDFLQLPKCEEFKGFFLCVTQEISSLKTVSFFLNSRHLIFLFWEYNKKALSSKTFITRFITLPY